MDVKALAKSKRAHTQHHSKKPHGLHTNQKLKAPSDGSNVAGNAKKPLGKQVTEKTHRSQGASKLPSNWDRYEEEFEDPSASDGASQPSDVILPKSKGADYRHLIAEAQSQSQSQSSLYLDGFPSLDDVMPGEFNQGLGPMLSVRGEGILSRIGDNNFVVEDKIAATHEATFLSLNLHALAEKLANIELSQRLFIEADLLPSELCTEGLKTSRSQESDQIKTCSSEVARTISEEFSVKVEIANQNMERTSYGSTGSNDADRTLYSKGSISVNAVNVDLRQIGKSSQGEATQSTEASNFEAAAAEEELFMLLDSYNETKKIADPSAIRSNDAFPVFQQEASTAPSLFSKHVPDSSKTSPVIADLDDALDDLLEETSNVTNKNPVIADLDDALDELLEKTSNVTNKNSLSEGKSVLGIVQSSSSHAGTKSQVLDDFDSWLDTI